MEFIEQPLSIYESTQPISLAQLHRTFEASTSIGLRPTQEDRLVFCPTFFRDDASFFGIFDGTVGDDASHFIQRNIVRHICACEDIKSGTIFKEEPRDTASTDSYAERIGAVLKRAFLSADASLITHCAENKLHYASSTGVTAFLWKNFLTVAHVGDSKACIARIIDGVVQPEWLTIDHKPNMPHGILLSLFLFLSLTLYIMYIST